MIKPIFVSETDEKKVTHGETEGGVHRQRCTVRAGWMYVV